MEEIQLSDFSEKFRSIIDSVVHSHQPVIISDKGKSLVKLVPVLHNEQESWLGCMKGKGKIIGDII